jgi:hypothetical protein
MAPIIQATIPRKYPEELENIFGNNLEDIFGTETEQLKKIDIRSIAGNVVKISKLLEQLPNEGVLDVYQKFGKNARPTFLQVAVEVLKMIHTSKIFETYKLPKLEATINRLGGQEAEWSILYLRYPVQRSVKVWHILRDILIEWDGNLNDPAYVRVLSDGTMNVNDKQHGNFGRLIMGAERVLVEGVHSDNDSMDSNMYASRNIHNLESSWENNANVRVTRAQDFEFEGEAVKPDDAPYLEFFNLLDNLDCSWQERSLPKKAKVCQNGEKLYNDFCQYGTKVNPKDPSIFEHAVQMNVTIWPHGELTREFVWGACEFMKQMQESGFTSAQMRDIRSYIKRAVSETYPDNPKKPGRATGPGTLWGDVRAFLNTLDTKGATKDWRTGLAPNYTIAAGIRDLILNWNAYYKDHSNVTNVKLELPYIKSGTGDTFDVEVGFYYNGERKNKKGKDLQPYYRDEEVAFDHAELEFETEEDEADAI